MQGERRESPGLAALPWAVPALLHFSGPGELCCGSGSLEEGDGMSLQAVLFLCNDCQWAVIIKGGIGSA